MELGESIKKIRKALFLTQDEFGELIKRDKAAVSLYENGKRTPSAKVLKKLTELARKNKITFDYKEQ